MIYVVIPVYNDWTSVFKLIQEIRLCINYDMHFVIVDDSSSDYHDFEKFNQIESELTIVKLTRNLGHQKAISIGLSFASNFSNLEYAAVMDCDGEDRPSDLQKIINKCKDVNKIVFAQRAKRSEGAWFKVFYFLYRLAFKLFTGRTIHFGNFCVIPKPYLEQVVNLSEIWSHFSGGIVRSGVPYFLIPTSRGTRYFGNSKMNFLRLVLHGFSAVSVYADLMALRLMLFSVMLSIGSILGLFIVLFIKFFTDYAIPGWATFSLLALFTVLILSVFFCFTLLFNLLAIKNQRSVIPIVDYKDYIKSTLKVSI
ncbi:MAG TPA: glycosyltransferase [Allocoleopsis sp.]